MSGERIAHPDLRIGFFAQHTVESLVAGTSPIDHLRNSPNTATQDFRNFLGGWQFPGDRVRGDRQFLRRRSARLALALLAWNKLNLLLLDEPTNHLDLEMREALAEALSDFDGAIVMVSHDRHLIGLVSDQYWRVHDGIVEPFDGDLDDYAAWLRTRPGADNPRRCRSRAPAVRPPRRWRSQSPIRTSCRRPRNGWRGWKASWPNAMRPWLTLRSTRMPARSPTSADAAAVAPGTRDRQPSCWRYYEGGRPAQAGRWRACASARSRKPVARNTMHRPATLPSTRPIRAGTSRRIR